MNKHMYIYLLIALTSCSDSETGKAGSANRGADSTITTSINPRIEYTFQIPNDTTRNFYVTVFPEGPVKGTLILLNGFGELPTETLVDTDIYRHASKAGYITIIPALGERLFFYCDEKSQETLHRFIDTVFEKYKLPAENFFIGGYSLGGFAAFQYTERAYTAGSKLRRPTGAFGADPPLDLERIYNSMTSTDRPPKDPSIAEGEKMFTDLVQQVFKTNPRDNPQYFWKISVFSFSDTSHAAIKPLVSVPLRVYHDPDINWYIRNRRVDYTDLNVVDGAALVNWLASMGNGNAELIHSLGKGFKNKVRWPHSWSIIDGKELVAWMSRLGQKR